MSALRRALVSMVASMLWASGDSAFFAQDVHADDNGHEGVVQIVGDAADERAEAFEALGAEELFLQLLALGDVGVDDEQGFGLARLVADERGTGLDDDGFVVPGKFGKFADPFAAFLEASDGLPELIGRRLSVKKQFAYIFANRLGGIPPVNPLGAFVPIHNGAVQGRRR